MRILLIGEYSGVYRNLSDGLKDLGHKVTQASAGDNWKNFSRDIDLNINSNKKLLLFLIKNLSKFSNYDVVQVINPLFLFSGSRKSEKLNKFFFLLYKTINKQIYLSALGDDYFWVNACLENKFEYSQLSYYKPPYDERHFDIALNYNSQSLKLLNKLMAEKSNGIIAGCYDYYLPYYQSTFKSKTKFIPFPINVRAIDFNIESKKSDQPINFFIGIQKTRNRWKGTDILLDELIKFRAKYPNSVRVTKVESVPFRTYNSLLDSADIVIDQLFSYSPGINGLIAMSKAKIVVGGGEPEMYQMLNEKTNMPIINVKPDIGQIQQQFEYILDNRQSINDWKYNSRKFVEEHHDHIKVAAEYVNFWSQNKNQRKV